MRKVVTCIAAGLLVLSAAAVGQTQDRERRGDQRGAKQQSNRGAERGPERGRPNADRGGERRRAVRGERRPDRANERNRAAEQTNERRRAAEQADRRRRAADEVSERKRAAGQADRRRRAADEVSERRRAAEQVDRRRRAADEVGERRRAAEQANRRRRAADEVNDRKRAADEANGRKRRGDQGRAASADGKRDDPRFVELRRKRLQLAPERRLRLRSAFNVDRRERMAKVRFERRIGARIPRSVRLFFVPAAVLSIFPEYRDYRYVVVDDDICIVDPVTYEIVDVIDEGDYLPPAGVSQSAHLTLTPAERALVLDSIPPDFPEEDVRLRLALGAEIPDHVQLNEFAPIVLDNVPRLRDFRFILTDTSVVIVDPRDRSIELVLER